MLNSNSNEDIIDNYSERKNAYPSIYYTFIFFFLFLDLGSAIF